MRKELGSCCTWAVAYALAGLVGNLVSIAVFDFYDPVHWPILLLPHLALFLPALAPLALVHIAHLRPRIGAGAAMAVPIAGLGAGPMITWRSFLLVLAMVGGLWTGAVLLPPMLLVGSFWRWLLQGGAALAIGAVAVYLAWSSAIDFNWWAWPAGIVAASLVFALLTYSLVRPALSLAYSSTPPPSPTDM